MAEEKKRTIHVNLNSKRLHEIRMARREEYRRQAQAVLDSMPDRDGFPFDLDWDHYWPLDDGYCDWD
jgi:hypothetical protein